MATTTSLTTSTTVPSGATPETIYEKIDRACRLNPSRSKERNADHESVTNGVMDPSTFIKTWADTFDTLSKTDLTCARMELIINSNMSAMMFIARLRRRAKYSQLQKK